jgi:PIN domain nuclease of toxin-antitoxin system
MWPIRFPRKIAQSIEEKWPIVTADPRFARYTVDVIW